MKNIMGSTICILQPGRIGDILLVIPIAYEYYKEGYDIVWPICSEYKDLLSYVNFPIDVRDIGPLKDGHSAKVAAEKHVNKYRKFFNKLDLALGFGDRLLDMKWKHTNFSFDVWKYKEAEIDYEKKYNLPQIIKRNYKKEAELEAYLKLDELKHGYVVTHSEKASFPYSFDFPIPPPKIEVKPIPGFTVFDWISVLEKAKEIYAVDSCIVHLMDQLGIGKNRRYVKFWPTSPESRKLYNPKVSNDWKEYS